MAAGRCQRSGDNKQFARHVAQAFTAAVGNDKWWHRLTGQPAGILSPNWGIRQYFVSVIIRTGIV
jgi:hypothetical protein